MMKATRPSIWIPTIMVVWGVMCVVMGLVKTYGGLMAARSALGIAEGGLFPGVTFLYGYLALKHVKCTTNGLLALRCGTVATNVVCEWLFSFLLLQLQAHLAVSLPAE
jgi:hypothetical protein